MVVLDSNSIGLLVAIGGTAGILGPVGTVFGIWITNRSTRKIEKEKNETEGEKNEITAQDSALKILNDRLDKTEKAAEAARIEFKDEMIELKTQITTLNEKLSKFDEMWQWVMSTVQQLFWQIYRQWPHSNPPRIDTGLIQKLDQARVGHIFPNEWRNQPHSKEK